MKSSEVPSDEFHSPNGTPLHHRIRRSLTDDQKKKLKECGIEIIKGPFTTDEDNKIRLNWIRYAVKENVDLDRAFEFAGGYTGELRKNKTYSLLFTMQKNTRFLQRICEGLENRTARQITERMRRIFHPSMEKAYAGSRGWEEEEVSQLKMLLELGLSVTQISIKMGRTKKAVEYKIDEVFGIKRPKKFSNVKDDDDYTYKGIKRKIIDHTNCLLHHRHHGDKSLELLRLQLLEETGGCDIVHLAMSEQCDKVFEMVEFDKLSIECGKSVHFLKRKWRRVIKNIRDICFECNGDVRETYVRLYGRDQSPRFMTINEFLSILKLILEQEQRERTYVDKALLQQRIEANKLTGFYTKGLSEASYVMKRVQGYIARTKLKMASPDPKIARLDLMDWITCIMKAVKKHIRRDPEVVGRTCRNFRILVRYIERYVKKQVAVADSRAAGRKEDFLCDLRRLLGDDKLSREVLDFLQSSRF